MANYIIEKDEELGIPVAIPISQLPGAREAVTSLYSSKASAPTINSSSTSQVTISKKNRLTKKTVIDVVRNYDWKVSPHNIIVEHPYIMLQEYRINKSPLLAQLVSTVRTGVQSLGGTATAATEAIGVLKDLGKNADAFAQDVQDLITNIEVEAGAVEEKLEGVLKPFQGLYYLKKTNFEYKLPYFSKKMTERTGNWDQNFPPKSKITDLIKEGINFVATEGAGVPLLGAYAEPGLYIERGKYFQPVTGEDPILVKFPLLNTLDPESIQKNFNLIWLLCFQNSSFRRNKTDVFPPCIYRVLIPGIRFMLYASISNITIEYVGTRRRVPVVHPATGETIDTTIPEAYSVELRITNLTTECGNFLLKSLTNVL